MKRSQSKRKAYDPHYWTCTTSRLFCSLGEHYVGAGVWMRFRRGDYRRLGSCEDCLRKQYGLERPSRPVVLTQGFDVRSRRAGGDE